MFFQSLQQPPATSARGPLRRATRSSWPRRSSEPRARARSRPACRHPDLEHGLNGAFFASASPPSRWESSACMGAMLAITGIFGMAAYSVSRRLRSSASASPSARAAAMCCAPRWAARSACSPSALSPASSSASWLPASCLHRLPGHAARPHRPGRRSVRHGPAWPLRYVDPSAARAGGQSAGAAKGGSGEPAWSQTTQRCVSACAPRSQVARNGLPATIWLALSNPGRLS